MMTDTGRSEKSVQFTRRNSEADQLTESGTKRLLELMNSQSFSASAGDELEDAGIMLGDIISGRDYITGRQISKPIAKKILRIKDGKPAVEYELEGES